MFPWSEIKKSKAPKFFLKQSFVPDIALPTAGPCWMPWPENPQAINTFPN